jgi:hypothetical protein
MSRIRRCLLLCLAMACAGCDAPPDDSPEHRTQERLVGTWLREYRQQGAEVRRVLVLDANGRFQERSAAVESGGAVDEHGGAGEWLFDGTNLKRRYTQMDGKQPSAPVVPFVTFELRFTSPDEFVGIDHVRKVEVRYRRVAEGTAP